MTCFGNMIEGAPNSKQNKMTAVKICIIGGGAAGTGIISGLQKALKQKAEFTLITNKDSFQFYPASVRGGIDTSIAKNLFVPYTNLFKESKGKIIQSEAVKIDSKSVTLKNGDVVEFDYLVVCTGIQYSAPFKSSKSTKEEAIQQFKDLNEDIKKSKSILLVGGGPTGVEVAGEIVTDYPDKQVTLIHGGSQLIPGKYKDAFKARVKTELEIRKVKVILGEKLEDVQKYIPNSIEKGWAAGPFKAKSSTGRDLEFDLIIKTSGDGKPNSDFLKSFGSDILDERGYVKVRPTMQFEKSDHLFSCGDVCNYGTKTLMAVATQAPVVVKNIVALINKTKLKNAGSPPLIIGISMGRNGGVGLIFRIWGNKVTRMMKSKELMIPRAWGGMNLPAPGK